MSRVRFRRKTAMLCLAGAAGTLLASLPAAGQQTGLRGPLGDSDGNAARLAQAAPSSGIPSSAYEPASPGALTESELLRDPADPFASPDMTVPLRRPGTAAARASRAEAEEPEEPANEPASPEDPVTGALRVPTLDEEEALDEPRRLNERERPIEGGRRRVEDDPYAPLGLRLGTFVIRPSVEQGLTSTTNASNSPEGRSAVLSETTLRLNAASDWSRHRGSLDAFGTFRRSLSGEELSETEGGANANLELDLGADLIGRAALVYSFGREGASSPLSLAGVEEQPLRHTIDGSLGLEKALGPLRLGATGQIVRNQYGHAELADGTRLSQSDRDSTLALLRLRGGYEISPALMPFIEVEAGRRVYDEERDSAGYARSATRLGARAGLSLEMSEKLEGEISAGWISENFEDERLRTISGLSLAANVNWSPIRGTIVGLTASTAVEGSTTPGASGSLLHSATLRLERQMRANLTGSLAFGAAYRDYVGGEHDLILNGEAALTWWLNRYAGITGRARHERQTSSLPGRDYDSTSVFMGLRLQR
jgi:hypothetical protein